jgi:ribosomal protein S18 acetylase RimI-like enzyme
MDENTLDPRAIARAPFVTPSPLERYRSGPIRHATHEALTLISAGEPGPDFNQAVVLGPARPEEVFRLAETFFRDSGAYSMVIEVETAGQVEREARRRGWRLDDEEPALVLAPLPTIFPSPPSELVIRQVGDAGGLADFRGVSETPSRFLPPLAAVRDPAVALFVGYVGEHPVATARLNCLGSILEVMGVVTVPAMRRRGYGTALTWAAVVSGQARGCTAATLTATAQGYSVYAAMGFRPVCVYHTYMLEEPGD